jgi:hypothetical protein
MDFKKLIKSFDLLYDLELLEDFLSKLPQNERDELYSHPLLQEYDLLP